MAKSKSRHKSRKVSSKRSKSKSEEKHHKKSKRSNKHRSKRRSRRAKSTKPEPTYAICNRDGEPIEKYKDFEAKSHTPSRAASRLARNHLLNKNGKDSTDICIRQKTRGKGYNKVLCYKVTQTFGEYKANDFMVKTGVKKAGDKKKEIKIKSNR